MDGDSGPGVGSAKSVVQAGGVGMIMFGVADDALAGNAAAGAQEVTMMESKITGKMKDEFFCIFTEMTVCRTFI